MAIGCHAKMHTYPLLVFHPTMQEIFNNCWHCCQLWNISSGSRSRTPVWEDCNRETVRCSKVSRLKATVHIKTPRLWNEAQIFPCALQLEKCLCLLSFWSLLVFLCYTVPVVKPTAFPVFSCAGSSVSSFPCSPFTHPPRCNKLHVVPAAKKKKKERRGEQALLSLTDGSSHCFYHTDSVLLFESEVDQFPSLPFHLRW